MQPQDQYDDPNNQDEQPRENTGKRHDIFYDFKSPEPKDSPTPEHLRPQNTPPQFPGQLPPEFFEPEPAAKPRRWPFIAGAVVLVIVCSVIFFLIGKSTNKQAANNSTSSNSSQNSANNTTTTQDPDLVNTPCYSFDLPKPHETISNNITSCNGTYLSGTNSTSGITIKAALDPYTSLDDMIAAWKKANPKNTVTSENKASFGQYSAQQEFWTPPGSPSETDMTVIVFTSTGGNNPYTEQGAKIYGFNIDGRYDSQSSSKTVYDNILASWKWK